MEQRIVLAYDGRPEMSGAIASVAAQHGADVVTLTLDIGDGTGLDGIRDLSLASGAIRAHVLDVRDEFARDIIVPAARAGTLGPLARLARPLLAKKLVDVARIEKAAAVAYVRLADDEQPLEPLVRAIDPALKVLALDGVATAPEARVTEWRPAIGAPSGADVAISFKDGVPTTINGVSMRLPELLDSLTTIAAGHRIGREGHEFMPAMTVLHAAYRSLTPAHDGTVRLKLVDGRCHAGESATAQV
jgi:argininosuccinate synthase